MRLRSGWLPLVCLTAACSSEESASPGGGTSVERVVVHATAAEIGELEALFTTAADPRLVFQADDDPEAAAARKDSAFHIAVVDDGSGGESYRIDPSGRRWVVRGGLPLGVSYGVGAALERLGWRFFHPDEALHPTALAVPSTDGTGVVVSPERKRRGLRPHTIHPIEANLDLYVPGADELERSKRIIDWTVQIRGNYFEWLAMDNLLDPAGRAAWLPHTQAINEYAHRRGLTTGVGFQLFGASSLQKSFTLLDAPGDDASDRAQVNQRLRLVMDETGFDAINLSFGEFSGVDPDGFVSRVSMTREELEQVKPAAEMHATIHVGNYPDLRVNYQGEDLLYYFLVKFADARIVPWVHTVMYYDLFEDAGLAYLHEEFDEHREFLLDRLKANQPIGYFPETAYWVAFDNSVPTYLPLYLRSRHLDLQRIRAEATAAGAPDLDDHSVFSSGWEWGYWQNDYAALRMSHTLPASYEDEVRDMFAPYGERGAAISGAVVALADAQHEGLIVHRLAAYYAGRDGLIDAGELTDIIAAPTRPKFSAYASWDAARRAAFKSDTLAALDTLVTDTRAASDALVAAVGDETDPWLSELVDSMAVDVARAEFVAATWHAAVSQTDAGSDEGWLAKADAARDQGRAVVARRHGALHDPVPGRLTGRTPNPTLYQYGYLYYADTLCYWDRERAQVRNLVLGETSTVPGCIL